MPIQITCGCGKTLQVPDSLRGKKGRCPGCQAILDIPLEDAPPAGPEVPAEPEAPAGEEASADAGASPEEEAALEGDEAAEGAPPSRRPAVRPSRPGAVRRPLSSRPGALSPSRRIGAMSALPSRRFSVGKVLGSSFSAWFKGFPTIIALSLVAFSPSIIYTILVLGERPDADAILTWSIVTGLLQILLGSLLQGAIVFTVFQQIRGEPAGFGKCLSVGLSRMLSVIWVSILSSLIIMAAPSC